MDATLTRALDGDALRQFVAVRLELPSGYVIRLIDGSGYITLDGESYDGHDPTFGALAAMSSVKESAEAQSPEFSFTLNPPAAASIGTLADPKNQGSAIVVHWGLIDEMTGAVIGTPEKIWIGRLDNVRTIAAQGSITCEVNSVSAFDRLFVAEEAARLTPSFHQSMWPGETGLDFNVKTTANPYWGVDGGKTANVSSGTRK